MLARLFVAADICVADTRQGNAFFLCLRAMIDVRNLARWKPYNDIHFAPFKYYFLLNMKSTRNEVRDL